MTMSRTAWTAAIIALALVTPAARANPLGLSMTRIHDDAYAPGVPVTVEVVIEAAAGGDVKALGLYETLPDGWRFESVYANDNQLPAIVPPPGAGPQLEFAWITAPPMPCVLFYSVTPPENAWGMKEIRGVMEYRIEEGPYLLPEVVTVLHGPGEPAPSLILRGGEVMAVPVGGAWEDPGCVALDADGRDISNRIVVSGEVETDRTGVYRIRYGITYESGEKKVETERIVRVVAVEEEAPPGEPSLQEQARYVPGGGIERNFRHLTEVVADEAPRGRPETGRGENNEVRDFLKRLSFPDLSAYRPLLSSMQEETERNADAVFQEEGEMENKAESPDAITPAKTGIAVEHEQGAGARKPTEEAPAPEMDEAKSRRAGRFWIPVMACAVLAGLGAGIWSIRLSSVRKKRRKH